MNWKNFSLSVIQYYFNVSNDVILYKQDHRHWTMELIIR